MTGPRRPGSRGSAARGLLGLVAGAALVLVAGCGPVQLVATTNIPTPLVVKIPIGIALFIPTDFATYVHDEERWSTDYHIGLGKAQSEGITRLMSAMFERVTIVDSLDAGTQLGASIQAILEPSIEEYAFVTPRDAGSPFFAVSIKYRVNVYMPDGKLADSWGFTGYGTSPSQGLSSEGPLATATALAMRDAGAKLAVEFREQAVVRGLLPEQPSVDEPGSAAPKVAPLPALAPEGVEESGQVPGTGTAAPAPQQVQTPSDEEPSAAGAASGDPAPASAERPGTDVEASSDPSPVQGSVPEPGETPGAEAGQRPTLESTETEEAGGGSGQEAAQEPSPQSEEESNPQPSQESSQEPSPQPSQEPSDSGRSPPRDSERGAAPQPTRKPSTTNPKLERRLEQESEQDPLAVLVA